MPSLAVTQPYATRTLDLIDASDRSYRQIESAWASALQIQKAIQDLTNVDPVTGLAQPGAYFMPSSISATNRALYEMYINFLLGDAPAAYTGTGDAAGKNFTMGADTWTADTLPALFDVLTYVAVGYDATDNTTYVISSIASNTATVITATADVFANADTAVLIPKAVSPTVVLSLIMNLS